MLDTLTLNRAAARWKEAPLDTGATTRPRRSADNGEGVAGSFTGQRSSRRPVATPPGTALGREPLTGGTVWAVACWFSEWRTEDGAV